MRVVFILLFLLALPLTAGAKNDADCQDKDLNNAQYMTCFDTQIAKADVQLNKAWKKVYSYVQQVSKTGKSDSAALLLTEQRNWLKFKEGACQYYRTKSMDFGREGYAIGYGACQLGIIQDRVKYLDNFILDYHLDN